LDAASDAAVLYDHAWRSLAELKRGGKVEPAFYTNRPLSTGSTAIRPKPSVAAARPGRCRRVLAGDEASAFIAASAPTIFS